MTSPFRRRILVTFAGFTLLLGLRSTITSMDFSGRVPRLPLRPLRPRLRRRLRPRIELLLRWRAKTTGHNHNFWGRDNARQVRPTTRRLLGDAELR